MTENPDREDDWGSPTEWQQPPPTPPTNSPGGTAPPPHRPAGQPPPPPGYQAPPSGYQPTPSWPADPAWQQHGAPRRRIQNYMVWAILVTVLCFPPGIVAIYYASQVNLKQSIGDFGGAADAASMARTWVFVSLAIGVALWTLVIVSGGSGGSGGAGQ